METLKATSKKRFKVEFVADSGRNRGMSHPPVKRNSDTITAGVPKFKQHMPTSLRTKTVGLGRNASDEDRKSHREIKTISFANNNATYEEMLLSSMATPGLRPAEISIDEKKENFQVGHSIIPELNRDGVFLRTYSPIKAQDLNHLIEAPKVPNYRVFSTAGNKKDKDISTKIQSNENKPSQTTSQCYAPCHGKLQCQLCTPTVRRDDNKAESRLEVNKLKHSDDLIDRYHKSEEQDEIEATLVLGLFGITAPTHSSPKENNDLQPDSDGGNLLGQMNSSHPHVNLGSMQNEINKKEPLIDIGEDIDEESSSSQDLVSLDGSQKNKTQKKQSRRSIYGEDLAMSVKTFKQPNKKHEKMDKEQRRASSLKPTDSIFFQANLKVDSNQNTQRRRRQNESTVAKSINQSPDSINNRTSEPQFVHKKSNLLSSSIIQKKLTYVKKILINEEDEIFGADLSTIKENTISGRASTRNDNQRNLSSNYSQNNKKTFVGSPLKTNYSSAGGTAGGSPERFNWQSTLGGGGIPAANTKQRKTNPGLFTQKAVQEFHRIKDKMDPISDIESITFYKLMQQLCAPNEQFHGCELHFVDTAFFDSKQGKACEMILTNKEGFVTSIKNEKRLKFLSIQTHFGDVVRERRRAMPPANRDIYEDDGFFDRQTTTNFNMRATFGSDLNFTELQKLNSIATNDNNNTFGKNTLGRQVVGGNESTLQRDHSNTEQQEGKTPLRQSFTGARSTFVGSQNKGSSWTKKSSNSQATKKIERTGLLDLAIFRFEVDPVTLPNTMKTHNTNQSTLMNEQDSVQTFGDGQQSRSAQNHNNTDKQHDKTVDQIGDHGQIVKVYNEAQFLKAMSERATSRQWRALDCIQSCIKAQRGLGKHIPIRFTMQLDYNEQKDMKKEFVVANAKSDADDSNPYTRKYAVPLSQRDANSKYATAKSLGLTYDFAEIGDEYRQEFLQESKSTSKKLADVDINQMIENKLKQLRPKDYCLRQVLKMCFYLQKLHNKEILQINCDFFQDDNGEIWLFHASDILVRPLMKSRLEIKQEESILEAQQQEREKRKELRKLEQAEWKDFRKRLAKEEDQKRNLFTEQMSQLQVLKKQRKVRRQVKEERMQKVKHLGKQIGIGTDSEKFDVENNVSKKQDSEQEIPVQLSAKELKLKKYTETFHNYFMKQRKQIGVDKALEDSESEMDEHLEEQIDRMIEDREVKEKIEKLAARKLTILAKQKLENISTNVSQQQQQKQVSQRKSSTGSTDIIKNTIEAKLRVNKIWRDLSNEKDKKLKNHPKDRYTKDKKAQLARQFLNSRMRALRYEQVISDQTQRKKEDKLALFEKGDYLTDQLMENRKKSGILKKKVSDVNSCSSELQKQQEHSAVQTDLDKKVKSSQESIGASFVNSVKLEAGHKTHLGFHTSVDNKQYFNVGGTYQQTDRDRPPSLEYATTNTFQPKMTLTGFSNSTSNKTQSHLNVKKMKMVADKNYNTARHHHDQQFQKATLRYYAAATSPTTQEVTTGQDVIRQKSTLKSHVRIGAAINPRDQTSIIGTSSLEHQSQQDGHSIAKTGPRKHTSVMHVKNEDGSESIFLNREDAISQMPTTQNQTFYRAPQTANSSRSGMHVASAVAINRRQFQTGDQRSHLTLGETHASGSWGQFGNNQLAGGYFPSNDEIINDITISNNAYFNLDERQLALGSIASASGTRQTMNKKNQLYQQQRSVSPGLYQTNDHQRLKKKTNTYLRSIDRSDQERTHFFHLPEPHSSSKLPLHNQSNLMRNQKKRNIVTQGGTRKKSTVLITGNVPKKGQFKTTIRATEGGGGSNNLSRQQFGTNRTTLLSKYPAPISSMTLSTTRRTRETTSALVP